MQKFAQYIGLLCLRTAYLPLRRLIGSEPEPLSRPCLQRQMVIWWASSTTSDVIEAVCVCDDDVMGVGDA